MGEAPKRLIRRLETKFVGVRTLNPGCVSATTLLPDPEPPPPDTVRCIRRPNWGLPPGLEPTELRRF
eukprot:8983099-Alexandrium_andersonii.AAC.1